MDKLNPKSFCYFVTMSHESFITFNCNNVYIKNFNNHFNFCVSKSFYYSTYDALLRKALTCCDIDFTDILFHMVNLLNGNHNSLGHEI